MSFLQLIILKAGAATTTVLKDSKQIHNSVAHQPGLGNRLRYRPFPTSVYATLQSMLSAE